ncbi:MAG: DUF3467 domain-containing protein [Candidatus Aminicenantes bacterium]|nr:DUF3467 domain-containing protein [Candidatus Aminicenantes bacterium]NLH76016.1 DUF3467 domain-containing protein [Acidobacteriota bacterium]
MDPKAETKKVEIKVDEAVAVGQYASLAAIRHSREEFLFDFAFLFPDGPYGKLVSRVIVSPAHAKRFLEALQANIKRYEDAYGTIVPSDLPPKVDFIQ